MRLGGRDGGGRADEEEAAVGASGGLAKMTEGGIENEGVPGFAYAPESKQRLGREPREYVEQDDVVWRRIRHAS